jgi:hypothetical protein
MFESLASCFAFRCNTSLNMTVRLTSSSRVATLCPELFCLCAVPRPCKNVRLFLFLNFSAVHGEAVQWATPTVLKINRHDYYQTANKAGSVQDSVRVYDITATIGVDGKARIDSKLVEKESY